MRVNCNISAIIANNKLTSAQSNLDRSIERLSSGLKINHAEDDAAGLAIANKLHSQIKGLDQSSKNASDGISVVETAESALSESQSILQRIRELAVQAASDTNSADDRAAIQLEIDALVEEVDRISTDTEFNTMPLLNGSLNRRCYSDTDNVSMFSVSASVPAGEYILKVTKDATQATAELVFDETQLPVEGTVTINGAEMDITKEDTYETVMSKFAQLCDNANFSYNSDTKMINTYEYGITQNISITVSEELEDIFSLDNITAGTDAVVERGGTDDGFNSTAAITVNGRLATITDFGGFEMTIELGETLVADNGGEVTFTENVTSMGSLTVQLGANEGQVLEIDIPAVDIHSLGIEYINVCTQKGAEATINKLDSAISQISAIRSKLGAYQNRLDSAVTHLEAYEENITSAVSRVEDVDMAEEMTNYTQENVITQAATSMLAQANERPQSVLQLLQ